MKALAPTISAVIQKENRYSRAACPAEYIYDVTGFRGKTILKMFVLSDWS